MSNLAPVTVMYIDHNVGYDVSKTGQPALKGYFVPALCAAATGKAQAVLIGEACARLGLQRPWNILFDFITRCTIAPSLDIVAIDFVPAAENRMKVYVRLTPEHMSFDCLRHYFTLGGRLQSQAIDAALDAVWSIWQLLFGPCQTARHIKPLHNQGAGTAALCMYYDLRQGAPLPAPKVYIPVRHYCATDAAVSNAMERFFASRGNINGARHHGEDFRRILYVSLFPSRSSFFFR